jgi:pteridine reductase
MDLRGRVALVTGAGRRLGREIAIALGARGMHVGVHYHASESDARKSVQLIQEAGGEADIVRADLASPKSPPQIIEWVVSRFGALDILVNSAAVMERTPFGEVTADAWDAMFALNLRAPFLLSQAAAPRLRERRGAIVNIADLAAFETWPGYIPHGISKAGIVYLTRALARTLAPDVRVNGIAPGVVLLPEGWSDDAARRLADTTPVGHNGSPLDVTRTLLFLLESDYVTGETIIVDGGRHVRR